MGAFRDPFVPLGGFWGSIPQNRAQIPKKAAGFGELGSPTAGFYHLGLAGSPANPLNPGLVTSPQPLGSTQLPHTDPPLASGSQIWPQIPLNDAGGARFAPSPFWDLLEIP